MNNLRQQFIAFSVSKGVLRFGEFTTKAGRQSPYFFNAGLFHDGATLAELAQFYAQTLLDSGVMSGSCALSSCTQIKSAVCVPIQLKKPFLAAERMPFRLAEIIFGIGRESMVSASGAGRGRRTRHGDCLAAARGLKYRHF